jgi:hypothetical protein
MFLPGNFVKVKSLEDIIKTLDKNSAFEKLPFMPEMLKYCGQTFQIQAKITKTCYEDNGLCFGEFAQNNVVSLKKIRCDGKSHSDCKRDCTIFWKTDWLEHVENGKIQFSTNDQIFENENHNLKTNSSQDTFYCQMTELKKATIPINRIKEIKTILQDYKIGNYTFFDTVKNVIIPLYFKLKRKLFFTISKNNLKTDTISIGLKSGERVRVKPMSKIINTLDSNGCNKGLAFTADMRRYCGKEFIVRERLDKMILGDSGKMISLKNTVTLDGIISGCHYIMGGCLKNEFVFWREIWLERVTN